MTALYVTLVLDRYDGADDPIVRGTATLTPSMDIPDPGDLMLIGMAPLTVAFNAPGLPRQKVVATDSVGPQPNGWTWNLAYDSKVPGSPAAASYYIPAGPAAFTATNATPCVFTWTATASLVTLPNGTGVQLSGGSLPAGFSTATTYYVVNVSGSTFELAAAQGGSPLASTGSGSGNLTVVQYNLSALASTPAAQPGAQYLPLPSGTPSSGKVPVASGSGEASAWGDVPVMLAPSGDASGAADTAAINAALAAGPSVILAPGAWYVTDVGFTVNTRRLLGSGPGTVVNVVAGNSGFTFSGPGQVELANMAVVIGAGSYGLTVNGAYDMHVHDLWMSGSSAAGGIKVNGDDSLEQHYTDIVMRDVGGINFDYERTTSIYTGSLYLDRVRMITPPAGAHGFKFNSTAGSPSLNTVFMTQCVADAFLADACLMNNVAQVFVTQCWFAVGASAAGGSAPLHLKGTSFQHTYEGCYTYTGLSGGSDILVEGTVSGVNIGGGHVFDGGTGNTALHLGGASGNVTVGTYLNYCQTFCDLGPGLVPGVVDLTSAQVIGGAKTFKQNVTVNVDSATISAQSTGSSQFDGANVAVYNTASSMGNQGGAALQAGIANVGATQGYANFAQVDHTGAFVQNMIAFDLNGLTATLAAFLLQANGGLSSSTFLRPGNGSSPGGRLYSGSGAPTSLSGNFGDFYFRTDTGNANQRIYFCDGGTSWAGIA